MGRARSKGKCMDKNIEILIHSADNFLSDFQPFHSELQIENFIVSCGGDGHVWGMYIQCLREIDSRKKNIITMVHQIRKLDLDIAEAINSGPSGYLITRKRKLARARSLLLIDQITTEIRTVKQHLKDSLREFACFIRIANNLKEEIGTITESKRRELDFEYWKHRLTRRAVVGSVSEGRPPAELLEMFPNLDLPLRRALEPTLSTALPYSNGYMRFFDEIRKLELVGAK